MAARSILELLVLQFKTAGRYSTRGKAFAFGSCLERFNRYSKRQRRVLNCNSYSLKMFVARLWQNFALVKILQFLAVSVDVAVLLPSKLCNSRSISLIPAHGLAITRSTAGKLIQPYRPSQLGLIARRVLYMSQLAFRYLLRPAGPGIYANSLSKLLKISPCIVLVPGFIRVFLCPGFFLLSCR